MNYWQVKWSSIEKDFVRKIEQDSSVRSYFETDEEIFVFIKIRGVVFYSGIPKNQLKDVDAFKLEFLSNAYELQKNPLNKEQNIFITEKKKIKSA